MKLRDTFFYGPRFWSLCRKDILENWKINLLRLCAVYGILAVIFVWNGISTYSAPSSPYSQTVGDPLWGLEYWVGGLWGFFILGSVSASLSMERLKRKTGRISCLMLPATTFEKFLGRWLFTSVFFVLAYWVAFHLADLTRVAVCTMAYPDKEFITPLPLFFSVGSEMDPDKGLVETSVVWILVALYCFLHSFFMLGSTLWPRNALVKTFAAGIAICVLYVAVGNLFWAVVFADGTPWGTGYVYEDITIRVFYASAFVLSLINWTLAYFRFKESEIINRW